MATKNKKPAIALDEMPVEEVQEPTVLTVNGQPIPIHLQHLIPYAATDQGILNTEATRGPRAYTEVVRDAYDKQTDRRNSEVWESEDPMRELVDSVRVPGMGYRFLSPKVIVKRGMRKYEPVRDEKGEEVKLGNMILGMMPIEKQEQRAKYYQDLGNDELKQAHENLRVEQERIAHDYPGFGPLKTGTQVADTGYDDATGDVHEIGIHRTRGAMAT